MLEHTIWSEKYRPKSIDECVLPEDIKKAFKQFVHKKDIPNMLLTGKPGIGKTTIAKATCIELGCDVMVINGSDESGIDVLRNKIKGFASAVSFSGGQKVVIIDEADYLNCLHEDEEIKLSDDSAIRLGDMKYGIIYDVVSFNTTTGLCEPDEAELLFICRKETYRITFSNGSTLECTKDHPIICIDSNGVYVERSIESGFGGVSVVSLKHDNIDRLSIDKIENIGIKTVIDIGVRKNHTFVTSNNIVVHNCNSFQPAMRNFMEEFSKNCRFILTANYKKKIIEPLISRLTVFEFSIPSSQKSKIAATMMKRIEMILKNEGVEFDKKVLAEVIIKFFPDFRKTISELQRYHTTNGKIDLGMLSQIDNVNVKDLMKSLKEKNFSFMRKWVNENLDSDPNTVIRIVFDNLEDHLEPSSIPQAILTLADYSYKNSFVADHELNLTAMFVMIMAECVFKNA